MIAIIVLWTILGIIAFIVIMLHFSVTAVIDLDKSGFKLKVKYLFFDIYPRKPKKKKANRREKTENIEKTDIGEPFADDFEEFTDSLDDDFAEDELSDKSEAVQTETLSAAENITPPAHEAEPVEEDSSPETDITECEVTEDTHKEDIANEQAENIGDSSADVKDVKKRSKGLFKPSEKKDKPKKHKTEKAPKRKSRLDELKEKYNMIKPYLPMGWKYFKKLLKTIRFTDTKVELRAGKEDAYEAAMNYGKIQGALFNVIAVISAVFTVKIKRADVECVFNEKVFDYDLHTVVRVRPSAVIAIGFCIGVNFLRIYLPKRRAEKRARKMRRKEREMKAKAAANNTEIS